MLQLDQTRVCSSASEKASWRRLQCRDAVPLMVIRNCLFCKEGRVAVSQIVYPFITVGKKGDGFLLKRWRFTIPYNSRFLRVSSPIREPIPRSQTGLRQPQSAPERGEGRPSRDRVCPRP